MFSSSGVGFGLLFLVAIGQYKMRRFLTLPGPAEYVTDTLQYGKGGDFRAVYMDRKAVCALLYIVF